MRESSPRTRRWKYPFNSISGIETIFNKIIIAGISPTIIAACFALKNKKKRRKRIRSHTWKIAMPISRYNNSACNYIRRYRSAHVLTKRDITCTAVGFFCVRTKTCSPTEEPELHEVVEVPYAIVFFVRTRHTRCIPGDLINPETNGRLTRPWAAVTKRSNWNYLLLCVRARGDQSGAKKKNVTSRITARS